MTKTQKSTALYTHPFSKAYWRDAAAELKDTRMLVFTALMIAVRIAMKPLSFPIAPGLYVNTAFLANALGAMVYGPVVAGLSACITDVLGYIVAPQGGVFFLPFMLTEIAGSMIFALFLYRAKVTPIRVLLSRFCICFFVNIVLQTPIYMWYYSIFMAGKTYMLTIPGILKNLFLFPIEAVILTIFLRFMQPITFRMKLTYSKDNDLHFKKREIIALVVLFVIGSVSVVSYLFYHFDHNSLSASYTAEERVLHNTDMDVILDKELDGGENDGTVAVVESAYRKFLGEETTYNVARYAVDTDQVAPGTDDYAALRGLSKSPAAKHEALTRVGTATIVVNEDTGVSTVDYAAE